MDNKVPEQENITVSKIDIDENTAEPIIVDVSVEELPVDTEGTETAEPHPFSALDEPEDATIPFQNMSAEEKHSIGKQLVMNKIIGYNREKEITKRQKTYKTIFTILFVVIILAALAYTAYKDFFSGEVDQVSFGKVLEIIGQNWYFLLFAILSLLFLYFFKGLKLSIMCKTMTGKFHFKTCLETSIVGVYYNNATPLAVGGQPFEIYHLSKHGVHGGCATSAPIATFFLNQLAFVLLGVVALILYSTNASGLPANIINAPAMNGVVVVAAVGIACCFIMPALVILFSFLPSVGAKLVHFVMHIGGKLKIIKEPKKTTYKTIKTVVHNSRCLKKLAKSPITLITNMLLSFLEQIANCSIAYFTLKFFGFNWGAGEYTQIIQLCLILYAAISFIPTPGNSVAADLSFFFLFEAGVQSGLAFPAMLVWRLLSFYSTLIIGFVFTSIKHRADKIHEAQEHKLEEESSVSEISELDEEAPQ